MTIYYVKAENPQTTATDGLSWGNAFSDLQDALDLAGNGDEIWIARGTYTPTTGADRDATFTIGTDIAIYGGFIGGEMSLDARDYEANPTILSGEIGDSGLTSDNTHHVVTASSSETAAVLDGLIIQDGSTEDVNDNGNDDGAGINNTGRLVLRNVIVQDNIAADDGGGIRNDGTLTIFNSTISSNTAIGTSNVSGGGGLLNTTNGTVTIVSSTFSSNTSQKNGGAIRNDGTLTMVGSTLSGNTADESGGGLVNTTAITNQIAVAFGADPEYDPAQATIISSTITNNTATNTRGEGGGSGIANFGEVTLGNSIVSGNLSSDDLRVSFTLSGGGVTVNPTGTFISEGYNLIGSGDELSGFNSTGDQTNVSDPGLEVLSDNEGFTQTHALTSASAALDAGSGAIAINLDESALGVDLNNDLDTNDTITAIAQLAFDQRGSGFSRQQDDPNDGDTDAVVDIGAFELQECFLAGTLIRTETGEIPVEALEIGDRVLTASGTLEPIKWIGQQTYHRQTAHPFRSNPIRIKPGALGDNLPQHDLYVSPDHALLVDGLLINAGALTNGVSIVQIQPQEDTFTYYHIELDHHSLLLAEGCAAESYLPQKQERDTFDNGEEYATLYPNQSVLSLLPMNYPRVSSKRQLPRYVAKRLETLGRSLYPQSVIKQFA